MGPEGRTVNRKHVGKTRGWVHFSECIYVRMYMYV